MLLKKSFTQRNQCSFELVSETQRNELSESWYTFNTLNMISLPSEFRSAKKPCKFNRRYIYLIEYNFQVTNNCVWFKVNCLLMSRGTTIQQNPYCNMYYIQYIRYTFKTWLHTITICVHHNLKMYYSLWAVFTN